MIGRTWFRTLAVAIVTAVIGGLVFSSLAVKYDLSFFQPRAPSRLSQLAIEQVRSGPASRLILVGIEGLKSPEAARLSRSLVESLLDSAEFRRLANGANALDEGGFRFLFENRYLLGPDLAADGFTPAALRHSISASLAQLGGMSGYALGDLLPADPTGHTLALIGAWQGGGGPHYKHGVWFSRDEKTALIVAATAADGDDQIRQAAAQALIEANFRGLPGAAGATLVMTGPPVISLAVSQSIQDESWWIGIGSVVVVAALLTVALRSTVLLLVVALPTAAAAIVGAVAVQLLFGSVHGIALTFGVTLAGVTSDYPVHLISHLRPGATARQTLRRIAAPLALGSGVTAAAFLPMTLSSFPGLSQLGVLAAVGVATGALVTALIVPWVVAHLAPRDVTATADRLLPALARAKVPIVALGLGGVLWLGAGGAEIFSDDLSRLNPLPPRLVELDRRLRGELGAPDVRRLFAIEGKSAEDVLAASERLSEKLDGLLRQGAIASYESPSRFLPSQARQRARQAGLPVAADLRRAVAIAVQELPVDAATFEPFIGDVAAAKTRPPIEAADMLATPLVGDRLASLLSRDAQGDWLGFVLLGGVGAPDSMSATAGDIGDDAIHYLDLQAESIAIIAAYRDEALQWLVGGLAVVVAVLFAALRWRRAARVVLSLAVSIALTATFLVAIGMALTPFHLVALLLVAGMGLDYALFLSRYDIDAAELRRTLRSIIVCAATTIVPFGLMAASSAPILRGIGLTVAVGVSLSLVSAMAICGGRAAAVARGA